MARQVLEINISGSTARTELDKMAVLLALSEKQGSAGLGKDWHLEKLRKLGIKKLKNSI